MTDVVASSQAASSIATPWFAADCSVVPIRPDGSKAPDRSWNALQSERMTPRDVQKWPEKHGVAVICGAISGNLEMVELEADWTDAEAMDAISAAMAPDIFAIWEHLCVSGYSEWSPSGGLHVLYRVDDHPVPGNTKIASAYRPDDVNKLKTKAETRGEGGYVIVAPTNGHCHPSGEAWTAIAGTPDTIPTIPWEIRNAIHAAIKQALDETPPPAPPAPRRELVLRHSGEMSPGDDFSLRTDWADILEPEGWTFHSHGADGERLWVRPGKRWVDGHSASTDYQGKSGLYVWSSSAGLPIEEPLTKFFVYAHYRHHGDMPAAARELRGRNFGTPLARTDTFMGDAPAITEVTTSVELAELPTAPTKSLRPITHTDTGFADMLNKEYEDRFRFIPSRNKWIAWDGVVWRIDFKAVMLRRAIIASVKTMLEQAKSVNDETLVKFALKQLSQPRINAAVTGLELLSAEMSEFDVHTNKLNMRNGLLDLDTLELVPHAASHMCTKVMGAAYEPTAVAPRWEQYLAEVVPDEETRDFMQRMVGYTLTGNPVERALAVLHGPGGTGKSRFIEVLSSLMDGYGTTASASLFRTKRDDQGPSNDLNDLRGARLASVSELDYGVRMDEALVKRLTGLDRITSRGLYEENQTWMPSCVIWLATNHMFKISATDDAIWDRVKVITFNQVIENKDPHILEKLQNEADGIFNWMLEGLAKYRERGLVVPEIVKQTVAEHRIEQDSISQFIEDMVADDRLVLADDGIVRTAAFGNMYRTWCKENGMTPLIPKNIGTRVESLLGNKRRKTNGHQYFVGISTGLFAPSLMDQQF